MHRDVAFGGRSRDFVIDETIVETGRGGIESVARKIHRFQPGPIDCAQTHRARFATGVENTVGQLKIAQFLTGLPYGHDFGVSGGIEIGGDSIAAAGYHRRIADDQSAERPSSIRNIGLRQFDRLAQKVLMHALQPQRIVGIDAIHERQAAVFVSDLVDLTQPIVEHGLG